MAVHAGSHARRAETPRSSMRRPMAGLLAVALVALSGCGSDSSSSASTDKSRPNLTVSAAASLKSAFTQYGQQFAQADVRFSFGGSDLLTAQILQGAKPDVFAAANVKLPNMLFSKNVVGKPAVFATNRLVLAIPAGSSNVRSLADLTKTGVTIAVGSSSVPVGAYTRTVLGRLGAARRTQILGHVRSSEPDVGGIVGKLAGGAVDAGFVYITDVNATRGKLRAIELPAAAQPRVAYAAVVVKGTDHPTEAQAFIDGLVSGAGQAQLRKAGFEPPPSP
jgi:molybdate transport system substrate-binding protein